MLKDATSIVRLKGHVGVEAVRHEAVLVGGVERLSRRAPRSASPGDDDARPQLRSHVMRTGCSSVGMRSGGGVLVLNHVDARLRGQMQEPQHLAGGGGHQQQLLGVQDRRVALALAGGQPHLLRRRGPIRCGCGRSAPSRSRWSRSSAARSRSGWRPSSRPVSQVPPQKETARRAGRFRGRSDAYWICERKFSMRRLAL